MFKNSNDSHLLPLPPGALPSSCLRLPCRRRHALHWQPPPAAALPTQLRRQW